MKTETLQLMNNFHNDFISAKNRRWLVVSIFSTYFQIKRCRCPRKDVEFYLRQGEYPYVYLDGIWLKRNSSSCTYEKKKKFPLQGDAKILGLKINIRKNIDTISACLTPLKRWNILNTVRWNSKQEQGKVQCLQSLRRLLLLASLWNRRSRIRILYGVPKKILT